MRAVSAHTDWLTKPARRWGNRAAPPTDLYPCKPFGRDDYVQIICVTDEQWDALCTAIDRPDLLVDPRFQSDQSRLEHREALYEAIATWSRQHTKHEAMVELATRGAVAGATLNTTEYTTDPHLVARDFVQYLDHPQWGTIPLLRSPLLLSESTILLTRPPLLGEHTGDVLGSDLGLNADEIADLRLAGAIKEPARGGGAARRRRAGDAVAAQLGRCPDLIDAPILFQLFGRRWSRSRISLRLADSQLLATLVRTEKGAPIAAALPYSRAARMRSSPASCHGQPRIANARGLKRWCRTTFAVVASSTAQS
jgi:CoA-transferase family III